MKMKRNFPAGAAIISAALIASLFLDKAAAGMVESIRMPALTGMVKVFNDGFFWIYVAMLAATFAAVFISRKKKFPEESRIYSTVPAFSYLACFARATAHSPICALSMGFTAMDGDSSIIF